jgi:hypothetical protein
LWAAGEQQQQAGGDKRQAQMAVIHSIINRLIKWQVGMYCSRNLPRAN